MQVVKDFNNISKELKDTIPTFEQGEIKTFEVLYGVPNPDPDPNEKMKNPILYGKRQLSTRQRIYDKFAKKYVDIGVVEQWNGETPERYKCFVPGFGEHRFMGKFSLMGGNIEDMELFEFLCLSNENESNEFRDKSVTPLFRLVDVKKKTATIVNKVDILRKALNIVDTIKEDKAREVWAALNQNNYALFDELRGAISEYAKMNPEQFIAAYESADTPLKAELKFAFDKGILEYDLSTGKITQGNNIITTLEGTQDVCEDMAKWINTAENGDKVMKLIRKLLKDNK